MKRKTMKKLIVVAVVLIVGGLFATGVLKWRDVKDPVRAAAYKAKRQLDKSSKGRPTQSPVAAKQCVANLRLIESAKRRLADVKGLPGGHRVTWAEVWDELARQGVDTPLRCPAGGQYELMQIGTTAQCTVRANNSAQTEDDHILKGY